MHRIWGAMLLAVVLLGLASCAGNRRLITSNGVYALKLGEAMPAPGIERLKGHFVRDTFVEQGEFQWREIVMEYRKGRVYLEEDFYGSASCARVRVYTPELHTRNGLRVGMAVQDLLAKASDWTLAPLPDYNLFDAYSRTLPRIHFLIDDPTVDKSGSWEEYKLSQLAAAAKIKMIVVF